MRKPRFLNLKHVAAPIIAVLLAAILFTFCYRYDNKYNTKTPQPRGGILLLDETTLERYQMFFLVNGWEIYPGLLTPEDIREDPLRFGKEVFIGQHTGFDFFYPGAPRHGSATLLLNIAVPEKSRLYALELPEIYSAYVLYVNGAPLIGMGDPSPSGYSPLTGNRSVTFSAAGNIEIVIAMSDYSHIYSGLVYPPAFGKPEAVEALLATRLALRSGAAAVALFLGLFFLAIYAVLRKQRGPGPEEEDPGARLALLYGALCLCVLGYAGYPVVKSLGFGGMWWYALESFCYCAMLMLAMLLQKGLCGFRGPGKTKRTVPIILANIFPAFGAAVSICAILTPVIARGGQSLIHAWSWLVGAYFIICACYLTAAALYGLSKGLIQNRVMLCGALVFDAALVMDRLLPDHEPILTGWFTEWAGLVLMILTGIVIAQNIVEQYRRNRGLEQNMSNMQQMMEAQQAYYPLVTEQAEQARAARHDLRHHMTAVRELAASGDNERLAAYLHEYGPATEPASIFFCSHPILNMLLSTFAARAKTGGVRFSVHVDVPDVMKIENSDLFAVCANLIENALEATCRLQPEHRNVEVGIRMSQGSLAIAVDNSFDGEVLERDSRLLSRKRPGREGTGAVSVRQIAASYGGTAAYRWEKAKADSIAVFHADVVLHENRGISPDAG